MQLVRWCLLLLAVLAAVHPGSPTRADTPPQRQQEVAASPGSVDSPAGAPGAGTTEVGASVSVPPGIGAVGRAGSPEKPAPGASASVPRGRGAGPLSQAGASPGPGGGSPSHGAASPGPCGGPPRFGGKGRKFAAVSPYRLHVHRRNQIASQLVKLWALERELNYERDRLGRSGALAAVAELERELLSVRQEIDLLRDELRSENKIIDELDEVPLGR